VVFHAPNDKFDELVKVRWAGPAGLVEGHGDEGVIGTLEFLPITLA